MVNNLEPSSGLDGWVEVEDQDDRVSGLSSDNSDNSDSNTRPAADGLHSGVSASLPLRFSRILNQGWQGLNERFSSR